MSILTLTEAQKIDPEVDLLRLGALEAMIRARTANRFHNGHSFGSVTVGRTAVPGEILAGSTEPGGTPPLLDGDTVELLGCGYADGLYEAVGTPSESVTPGAVILKGAPLRRAGVFPEGKICLVQYPADIVEGVKSLLRYDVAARKAAAAAPAGVEQLTVGRVTEKYGSTGSKLVETAAGSYPAELLDFLTAHRRLSWGV